MQSNYKATSTAANTSKYVKYSDWDVKANRYMQPKLTDRGLKTIAVINTQKNKKLHIQLPAMTCWGITDYTDQVTGESDSKFSIKLHFKEGQLSDESKVALEKLQKFEQQILDDAVTNSEAWFGKKQIREIVEFSYFPFLKMAKNAETKQPDAAKGIYFRPKVNCYSNQWDVEVFDPEGTAMFPSENESETPMDFVPAGSEVTCGIECKQIWVGAKGWGLSWALKQCVVIPKLTENMKGKLQLDLSDSVEIPTLPKIPAVETEKAIKEKEMEEIPKATTFVEDSDNEAASQPEEVPATKSEAPAEAVLAVKKKVVRKKV